MAIIKANKDSEAGALPSKELLAAMGKFSEEMVRAGVLLAAEGLQPSAKGARVRFSGATRRVIDGPFTESKELVGGFWLLQVKSKEEAIKNTVRFMEVHKQYWPGWEGVTEIRQQTFVNGRAVGAD